MSIACLLIPYFPLRITLLQRPELDGLPLVLTTPPGERSVVAECVPEARARGIKRGMPLRDVMKLCWDAVFIQPNPARDRAIFDRLLTHIDTFSSEVEPGEPGCCYINLDGLERHYASIDDAVTYLLSLIPSVLRPRVGVAPGKFTAWAAARSAQPGGMNNVTVTEVRSFLRPLPLDWLPVADEIVVDLIHLGFRTLGDVADLPMTAVQARFGPAGRLGWELANGRDEETIRPRQIIDSVVERMTLPGLIASREMLLFGLKRLIASAFRRPELRYRGVRQARLSVMIEENRSWEKEMTFREPVGQDRVIEILSHRLAAIELPGAAEAMSLELVGITTEAVYQEWLPGLRSRRTHPLVDAARQLKQRYGESPLYHVVEVEPWSRIPERRHALLAFDP